MVAGWMAGWLDGWMTGWLAGWLAGWMACICIVVASVCVGQWKWNNYELITKLFMQLI